MEALDFPFMETLAKRDRSVLGVLWDELQSMCDAQRRVGPVVPQRVAADALGISAQAVQNYIDRGRLEAVDLGGRQFVTEASIKEFAKSPRMPGRPRKYVDSQLAAGRVLSKIRSNFAR